MLSVGRNTVDQRREGTGRNSGKPDESVLQRFERAWEDVSRGVFGLGWNRPGDNETRYERRDPRRSDSNERAEKIGRSVILARRRRIVARSIANGSASLSIGQVLYLVEQSLRFNARV